MEVITSDALKVAKWGHGLHNRPHGLYITDLIPAGTISTFQGVSTHWQHNKYPWNKHLSIISPPWVERVYTSGK